MRESSQGPSECTSFKSCFILTAATNFEFFVYDSKQLIYSSGWQDGISMELKNPAKFHLSIKELNDLSLPILPHRRNSFCSAYSTFLHSH